MPQTTRFELLRDYRTELKIANHWKSIGISEVTADVAGPKISNGRKTVPIADYISHWEAGISALENGGAIEDWEY